MILNGADAVLLNQGGVRYIYPFLNFDNARPDTRRAMAAAGRHSSS